MAKEQDPSEKAEEKSLQRIECSEQETENAIKPKYTLEDILLLTVLAGDIMLRNGAETSRIEETMVHMAKACGAVRVEGFVILTGVFLTLIDSEGRSLTTMRRVSNRTINLDRIAKVNELSRRLSEGRMEPKDVQAVLERIAQERTGFSLLPSMFASGVIGGTYALLQEGVPGEVIAGFLAAFTVRYIAHVVTHLRGGRFTFEFLGAAAAAAVGWMTHMLRPDFRLDLIVIGGIMPLVPGVAVTNAIRDVIAGDLLSGLSRGLEAAVTSVAVAMGVVIVLSMAV